MKETDAPLQYRPSKNKKILKAKAQAFTFFHALSSLSQVLKSFINGYL